MSFLKRFNQADRFLVLGIVLVILLIFSVFPLGLLIFQSLWENGISFTNYQMAFADASTFKALWNTLMVSTGTMICTVILGVPLGWLISRTDLPWRKGFKTLLMLPYIIPPYIGAIAWIQLLNPKVGYINTWFKTIFGLSESPFNIYSIAGLILVLSLFFYPFVLMATTTALDNMDNSLEESARMSGASQWKVLKDVTFPLILPSIISGAFLAFVATAASFGVPAIIGRNQIFVLTTLIYKYINLGTLEGPKMAIAVSVVLMIGAAIILSANAFFSSQRKYVLLTGKSTQKYITPLGKARIPVFLCILTFFLVMILLPLGTIFMTSLLKTWGRGFGLDNLSFNNYTALLFQMGDVSSSIKALAKVTQMALFNSLMLAVGTATIAVFIGALIAYINVKTNLKGRHLVDLFAAIPYATPGTIVALGVILAFTNRFGINLANTLMILLIAYCIKYLSFAVRTVASSLEQLDDSLEEAGIMSGASWFKTLQTIIIPILKPSLIAGWFLIFMPTFSELTMSILLFGPKTATVGTVLYELQTYESPPLAAVLACLIVIIVLSANAVVKKITGGKYGI